MSEATPTREGAVHCSVDSFKESPTDKMTQRIRTDLESSLCRW